MKAVVKSFAITFGCLLLAACATSPTGRTQLMVFPESSAIAASKQAYSEMLTPLAEENKLNNDPALERRVDAIVERIKAQAVVMRPDTRDWNWEMTIIDDPKTVNAWAMAGGKMALYSGLVQQLEPSDDELAQVLAHELAHALAKHSVEKMSVAAATNVGVQTVGVATGSGLAMQGSALLAALAVSLPNSRSMETEADRIGIELAAKAGYDPRAAVTLWEKMGALGSRSQPQFLSTHPHPATRQAALTELVPQMMPFYEQARAAR
ncbi:MAG: M48 family metallopeptidase [Gammaproteobacteria bacterium]